MLLVGSVLSSLALVSAPSVTAASPAADALNAAQRGQFGDDDLFAGDTPLTNNELMAARGGIRLNGAEYQIGAQISRQAMQSSLNTMVYQPPAQSASASQHTAMRARRVGPVNTGVGAANTGVGAVGVGPVDTGVVASNTVGPVNLNAGPANIGAGPAAIGGEPVNINVGSAGTGVGPINVEAGPVNIALGPVNTNAGPVETSVVPTINVDIDVSPTVNVNVGVDPQTGASLTLATVNGVEVLVAPQGPVTTTIGDINVQDALSGGAGPQTASAGLPVPSANNVQVVLTSNAIIEVIDQLADVGDAGSTLVTASVPITEGIRSVTVNITRNFVTVRRTIGVDIFLPDNFINTTIQPGRQMSAFARSVRGNSMLGALGN